MYPLRLPAQYCAAGLLARARDPARRAPRLPGKASTNAEGAFLFLPVHRGFAALRGQWGALRGPLVLAGLAQALAGIADRRGSRARPAEPGVRELVSFLPRHGAGAVVAQLTTHQALSTRTLPSDKKLASHG